MDFHPIDMETRLNTYLQYIVSRIAFGSSKASEAFPSRVPIPFDPPQEAFHYSTDNIPSS